jgi:hypothetical protein
MTPTPWSAKPSRPTASSTDSAVVAWALSTKPRTTLLACCCSCLARSSETPKLGSFSARSPSCFCSQSSQYLRSHSQGLKTVIVLVVEVNPCPAMQSTYFDNYLVLPGPSSVSQAISEEDSSRSRLAIKQPDIDHTIQKVPIPLFESRNKYNPRWKQPF